MPKVKVYNQEGVIVGSQELSDKIFGVKPKVGVVHQVAVGMMANRRQVLAHTKDRGEVRGGGIKPWRQKGTGRARHGSIRSPLWVGGGVTFGPTKERNFKKKINNKMRRKAIFMCLTDRVADGKLILLDEIDIKEAKTKLMVELVDKLREVFGDDEVNKTNKVNKIVNKSGDTKTQKSQNNTKMDEVDAKNKYELKPKKILVLIPKKDEKIQRACLNLKYLKCILARNINVLDILGYEYLMTSVEGVKKIEATFQAN